MSQKSKYMRRWRSEHKERQKEYDKCYYQKHKETRRELRQQRKLKVLTHYSVAESYPVCAYCGITDIDVLTIDHIDGMGRQHRKKTGSGTSLYRWLDGNKFPTGFQVLCANCNLKKMIQRGETRRGEPKEQ